MSRPSQVAHLNHQSPIVNSSMNRDLTHAMHQPWLRKPAADHPSAISPTDLLRPKKRFLTIWS